MTRWLTSNTSLLPLLLFALFLLLFLDFSTNNRLPCLSDPARATQPQGLDVTRLNPQTTTLQQLAIEAKPQDSRLQLDLEAPKSQGKQRLG
ncbi:uncharacterized protein K452DRAFT_22127 [Aplosporella prunicola CBS 121167]|uniref:Uncharacterized protein n=1 Tax=Aplosporella prunicola CBS 121167 TaxID=1176127 RepID=A0A6A6BH70_9PEZI|nr:uncharacterized protein K452DRAFT_22127 [Aplosporella prunicola CBS 121167]KAF2142665.1 hypothetical protein K452DRAFT_22127 [Aplosporella prunicola CBS 121167]